VDEQRGYEEVTDDDDSELESQSSGCSVIHDIRDAVDSLYKLSPALDFFLETFSPPDPMETVYLERLIGHMFPRAQPYLIERLTIRTVESRKKLAQPASFQAEVRTAYVVHYVIGRMFAE
jgi:hypothetical protein